MTDFTSENLTGSRFEDVYLTDADGSRERGARPSVGDVLALRADRMATVGQLIAGLTTRIWPA